MDIHKNARTTPRSRAEIIRRLNPPDKALVLCVDEKRQMQALDRSQPILPLRTNASRRGNFARSSPRSMTASRPASTCISSSIATGASGINLVERWFAALTEKQLRRGVH
jgi:hypothetical protein